MSDRWILDDDRKPVRCADIITWAKWFETSTHRIIKQTDLGDGRRVSTVFLGIDHNFSDSGLPILYETMVFDSEGNGTDEARACSEVDALLAHDAFCEEQNQ